MWYKKLFIDDIGNNELFVIFFIYAWFGTVFYSYYKNTRVKVKKAVELFEKMQLQEEDGGENGANGYMLENIDSDDDDMQI
jgi:hypothetical protein